jgi:tellurite methyltransferase
MTHSHDSASRPAQFLRDNLHLLPRGHVLDIAMGKGRNAIYLARMGFDVEGVDISPEAVSDALEDARRVGLTIKAKVADLENRYLIRKGAYDLIICFRYLQRSLIPQIKDGLRNGGMIVYETFTVDQVQFGRPKNPDYMLRHNELLDMFRDFRCLFYQEGILEEEKALARIIAEKV